MRLRIPSIGTGIVTPDRAFLELNAGTGISFAEVDKGPPDDALSVTINADGTGARQDALMQGLGYKGWTNDPQTNWGSVTSGDGIVFFMSLGLLAGDVVTNTYINQTANATNITLSKCGLYSSSGTRLGISADQGSAWNSGSPVIRTVPLTSPFTVTTTGLYYLAVVAKASTTVPQFSRASTQPFVALGANPIPYGTLSGQTDLPSSAAISSSNASSIWMAWS